MRAVLEANYTAAFDLWISAIARGDLAGAAEMMTWRVALGAALQRVSA
jgi:hypothetical protein